MDQTAHSSEVDGFGVGAAAPDPAGSGAAADAVVLEQRAALELLPDAVLVLQAERDPGGAAFDLRVRYLNAAARAQQLGAARAVGARCSELWPDLARTGAFRHCLEVADGAAPASGVIEHTADHMGRPCGAEYTVTAVGPDLVLLVERDATAHLRTAHDLAAAQVRIRQLQAELADTAARAEAEVQRMRFALQDALTGLPNRAVLLDRAEHALIRSRRLNDPARAVALLAVDIDGFRQINDTFGRPVGDAALKTVAARLLASVRQEDTVARLGGDEFVVLCDNIDAVGLAKLRARVIESVTQPLTWHQDDASRSVPLPISVAVVMAQGDDSVDDLLPRVEELLERVRRRTRVAPTGAVR